MRLLVEIAKGRELGMGKSCLLKLPFWVKRQCKQVRPQAEFPFVGHNGLLASDFAQL